MKYLETVKANVQYAPDRAAVTLDFHEETMTYAELWEISGRVYRYLKEKGIGRENFVMIRLPRGPKPVAVILGVLRAGAAFTIVEDIYPEDRIAWIVKDCGCVLTIDLPVYEEILKKSAMEGFEQTDAHDACFAIYTSGTTGRPKGVLHEYGKLDYTILSIPKEFEKKQDCVEKFAAIMPMNFVAFLFTVIAFLYNGDTISVVSFAVAKNFVRFTQLLEVEQITECFMSPSMIRVYTKPASTLKLIATGSEPANGIYYGSPAIYNVYAMSESGMAITGFLIDRPYEKAPVGVNKTGIKVVILDEEGREVPKGAEGEICYENPYFRGYINLPDETEKALRGGIFHTGDLGCMDEKGNLLISGRSDDMIKINGNRIEPAEIEAVAKEILNVKQAVAKGFDEAGSAFVALYCLKAELNGQFDEGKTEAVRAAMEKKLPQYMIPSYFVALDEMPINENGKIARKLLRSPRAAELKREYILPENGTERAICLAMAKVLGLEKVGATEDFFYLGGDSLKTIRLVSDLERDGIMISAELIYDGRDARKIAALSDQAGLKTEEELDREEAQAETESFPLLHGQQQMVWYYLQSGESVHSADLTLAVRMRPEIDPERLRQAADRVLAVHPALRTRLTRDADGTWRQRYDETLFEHVRIIEAGEDDVESILQEGLGQYGMLDQRMWHCVIIRTPSGCIFALYLNHVIQDGESRSLLLKQIWNAYLREDYVPEKDYYFSILKSTLERQEEKREESETYYDEIFARHRICGLKPDHEGEDRTGVVIYRKGFMPADPRMDTALFLTAYAMAAAKYNGTDNALIYSLYHGRDDQYKKTAAGYLLQEVFISLEIGEDDTPAVLIGKTRERLAAGKRYPSSRYLMDRKRDISDTARFIYQWNMDVGSALRDIAVQSIDIKKGMIANGLFALNIVASEGKDSLDLLVRYAKANYEEDNINRFLEIFHEMIDHLLAS